MRAGMSGRLQKVSVELDGCTTQHSIYLPHGKSRLEMIYFTENNAA